MNLETLGWDTFFSNHYERYNGNGTLRARVARADRHVYTLYVQDSEMREDIISARVSGRFRHQASRLSDFPAVGDWVVIEPHADGEAATIQAVLPRRSRFSRKVPGVVTEEQVVAANVDTVFLVSGLDLDLEPRRIERYLTVAWDCGADPVIVLNKADLCRNLPAMLAQVELVAAGVPILVVSAESGEGIDALADYMVPGRTVALVGSSGVGKSSLINRLLGEARLKTGAVREDDSRGRHTTTHRELILAPNGGLLIDSPGMREIQLWGDEDNLAGAFDDVAALAAACRFRDCQHGQEPGCAVRQALEDGTLSQERWRSYQTLQRELRFLASREDRRIAEAETQRWKQIAKSSRQRTKHGAGRP